MIVNVDPTVLTNLAILNPPDNSEAAVVDLAVYDQFGDEVASGQVENLQPGQRLARSIVQLIPELAGVEFEDDLFTPYKKELLTQGLRQSSMYQKIISLERGKRYKLEVIVKDLHSGSLGVAQDVLAPPAEDGKLSGSSLVIADSIRQLSEASTETRMFVLGDVWIRPSMTKAVPAGAPFGVYLQVYNASLDQASSMPTLHLTYRILQDGNVVRQVVEPVGKSVQFYSKQRIVLIRQLDLTGMEPGKYLIQLTVEDQLGSQRFTAEDRFDIVG